MNLKPVYGYRLRFDVHAGTGDVQLYFSDDAGRMSSELLEGLPADRFLAIAGLLATDKDHKIHWDGVHLDAGPEKI